jgi:hypothetical protein
MRLPVCRCPRFRQQPIQTRLSLTASQALALDAYASVYGKVERSLFAEMQADGSLNELKREFLPKFGSTARQFNAVRVGLEGKIDSIKACRPELIAELQSRIKKAQKFVRHFKSLGVRIRRFMGPLQDAMRPPIDPQATHLCFGGNGFIFYQPQNSSIGSYDIQTFSPIAFKR